MSDENAGYSAVGFDQQLQAAEGKIDAHRTALIQIMRIISAGRTGEDAYQGLATGLRADAQMLSGSSNVRFQAAHLELTFLAGVFEQPPRT